MRLWREASKPHVVPLLLGGASVAGLLIALVGEGLWNWLAWALVAAPIPVVGKALLGARPRP